LIPLTTDGTGYMVAEYLQVDTPTPLNAIVAQPASNAPLGCEPL
jgi:hypothetical protein